MKMTKAERLAEMFNRLQALGLSYSEAQTLRRIEMTLHRWCEQECGDGNDYASWDIERDEATNKPYRVTYPHTGKSYRTAIPDRETGALKRAKAIIKAHSGLWFYYQTDCRGCALYVGDAAALNGQPVESRYNRGVAVCA